MAFDKIIDQYAVDFKKYSVCAHLKTPLCIYDFNHSE